MKACLQENNGAPITISWVIHATYIKPGEQGLRKLAHISFPLHWIFDIPSPFSERKEGKAEEYWSVGKDLKKPRGYVFRELAITPHTSSPPYMRWVIFFFFLSTISILFLFF